MSPLNGIRVVNTGKVPDYLIYDHDGKILIYKININHAIKDSDPEYHIYHNLPLQSFSSVRELEN